MRDIGRFWHLPLNDVTGKIALHDIDVVFEGQVQRFKVVIPEPIRSSAKMHETTFKDLDIGQMIPLRSYTKRPWPTSSR